MVETLTAHNVGTPIPAELISDSPVQTSARAAVSGGLAVELNSTRTHEKPRGTVSSTAKTSNENLDHTPIVNEEAAPPPTEDALATDQAKIITALLEASEKGNIAEILNCLRQGADELTLNEFGETLLHTAARRNQPKAVEALLKNEKVKININLKDNDGWTPLYSSAYSASPELVSMILKTETADLNVRNALGETPIHGACYRDTADVLKLLLQKDKEEGKSTIELADSHGWTPLHTACDIGKIDMVKTLLNHYAKAGRRDLDGKTSLHIASAGGASEIVSLLLNYDETLLDLVDSESKTALHLAAEERHATVVQTLVDSGAKVDLSDSEGCTALILSCSSLRSEVADKNDEKTVELLAKKTEDINHVDNEGYTALNWAIRVSEPKLIKILLEYKADPNINTIDGKRTILGKASYEGEVEIVKLLLKHGASINDFDGDHWTALHHACNGTEQDVVKILLEEKADRTIKLEETGEMPLHIAATSGSEEIVKLLLQPILMPHIAKTRGIDPDQVNRELIDTQLSIRATTTRGETALHLAVGGGHHPVVQILLDVGSDPNAVTNSDETPLRLAGKGVKREEKEYEKIIRVLSSKLDPKKRRETLLDFYGDEKDIALERLIRSLDWTGLDQTEVVGQGDLISKASKREEHDAVRKILQEKGRPKIQEEPLPSEVSEEAMTALQWAAYFGDHLTVWWLLYSDRSKEMRNDRQKALNIAKWCKDRLPQAVDVTEETTGMKVEQQRRPSNWVPSNWVQTVESKGNKRERRPSSWAPSNWIQIVESTGNKREQENERFGKAASELHKDSEARISDYTEVIDTLQDPPVDYDLVRGSSKKDSLDPKPVVNDDAFKELAKRSDTTIVDCYCKNKNPGAQGYRRADFLRRTRSVWDVVYETQIEQKRVKPTTEKDGKVKNKEPKLGTANLSMDEEKFYGPGNIMKFARSKVRKAGTDPKIAKETYNDDDLRFRWLHLPANNLDWMFELTKRIYRDKKKTQEDFDPLAEFLRQSFTELPGNRPYMRPSCTKEQVSFEKGLPKAGVEQGYWGVTKSTQTTAEEDQKNMPPKTAVPQHLQQDAGDLKKPESIKYSRLALYIPYLTFATYQEQRTILKKSDGKIETEDVKAQAELKLQDKNLSLAAEYSRSNESKDGGKNNAENDWKKLQESRTLDEYYYHSLSDIEKRNANQVVTRYIDKVCHENHMEKEQWEILRVDQLWLWVIDEKTIITSSTDRPDGREDPILEGIFNYLKEAGGNSKGQPPPSSVEEMTKFITTFCIDQIDKATYNCNGDDLSARQIFSNTINNAAASEASLFDSFYRRIKGKLHSLQTDGTRDREAHTSVSSRPQTDQEKEYESIRTATRLLLQVKDIRDELNILNFLLTQQKGVWEKLLGLSVNEDGSVKWNEALLKETEKWKGPGFALKDIIEMDKIAQRILDSVHSPISRPLYPLINAG
ncbi:hypothetical protein ACMFMG_002801 [Clarireedia jacksonii]